MKTSYFPFSINLPYTGVSQIKIDEATFGTALRNAMEDRYGTVH